MRLFISGSAPLLEQTWHAFFEQTGQRILERYGMSEAIMIASNPLEGERVSGNGPVMHFPTSPSGSAITKNQPVAAGETGVLQMRGPNVFKGLLADAGKKTAQ